MKPASEWEPGAEGMFLNIPHDLYLDAPGISASMLGHMMDSPAHYRAAQKQKQEAIRMWLAELKIMHPTLRDEYAVGQIHVGDHKRVNPLAELVELVEDKSKIVAVGVGGAK